MNTKIILLLIYFFSINTSVESDVKYVWASKLNLRTKPSTESEVVAQIPFGTSVRILKENDLIPFQIEEKLEEKYSVKDRETGRYRDSIVVKPMIFDGHWRKVIYENVEGYVFDFYLSKIPPLVENLGNQFPKISSHIDKWTDLNKKKFGCKGCDDNYTEYWDEEKNIRIEIGIKGKGGHIGIYLKNISLNEGKMIGFQLFKNNVNGACEYDVIKKDNLVIIESYCSC